MLKLTPTNQFKKDYKLAIRRGYNQKKLSAILDILSAGNTLPEKYRDHSLTNSKNYRDVRECHIEPDWLLIYRTDETAVHLIRTGTHSDLFG